MESPPARNLSSVREKVMEELVRGHAYAAQLQIHLELTGSGDVHLVTEILSSFTKALSILSSSSIESGEVLVCSPCQDHQRRKQFQGRKMQETSTRITAIPIEDGYAWRKYGQKEILNTKHLRSYYRCSYRFNKGCQASKQVQRTKDEPPTFWTKYIGHHTCQSDVLKASSFMDSTAEEGLLLNFESSSQIKQEFPFFLSFPSSKEEHIKSFPSIKQDYYPSSSKGHPPQDPTEFKSCIPTSALPLTTLQSGHGDVVLGCNTSSSSSLDPTEFKSCIPTSALPLATLQSGHGDVVLGCNTCSSSSLDMAMELMGSVYLNDAFWYSDDELF